MEVTSATATDGGDAALGQAELLARRGARGESDGRLAVEQWDGEIRTQRSLGKGDGEVVEEVGAATPEEGMLGHADDHVKVAGRTTTSGLIAFPRQP